VAEYKFLTTWLLDVPIEPVWNAIVDYRQLPTWWKAVVTVEEIQPGDSTGVGSLWNMVWKTPLAYTIAFKSRITRIEAPHRLELSAIGEMEGTGRWELSPTAEGTLVKYYWNVKTTKPWMNFLALFIRPLMEWNHNAIMKQGGEGLAHFLGARLLKAESADAPE
jgi:uncharacterized protein YndB with AHSA1/START domain